MAREACCLDGCDRPHHARGLCRTCYVRFADQGKPFPRPAKTPAPTSKAKRPPRHGSTSERYARFLELDRPGVTNMELAAELGCSERTVIRYRNAFCPPQEEAAPVPPPVPAPAAPAPLDDRQRQRLAERTLQAALNLAVMVRDEDATACREFVTSLPADQRDALPYVLAALIPVDQPVDALLEWITWDERGRPLNQPTTPRCTATRAPAAPATAKQHRDRAEPLCIPCQDAERTYRRDLYRTKKRRTRAA
ncbi:hypothetical protein [Planomonospora sp. ID82291]|uniref:hypothetical protein n=1 Tax=Planomonospora sp. ID82291 TaxID=2738136 RepID=UPI0018C431D2|nr:hypothetical protein [Planomonospora sp. ID82291]MBG0818963.1 hypothetical protein [Planomonospora sp. ID82291]